MMSLANVPLGPLLRSRDASRFRASGNGTSGSLANCGPQSCPLPAGHRSAWSTCAGLRPRQRVACATSPPRLKQYRELIEISANESPVTALMSLQGSGEPWLRVVDDDGRTVGLLDAERLFDALLYEADRPSPEPWPERIALAPLEEPPWSRVMYACGQPAYRASRAEERPQRRGAASVRPRLRESGNPGRRRVPNPESGSRSVAARYTPLSPCDIPILGSRRKSRRTK